MKLKRLDCAEIPTLKSNPKVRMKFVERSNDASILKQVSENDLNL